LTISIKSATQIGELHDFWDDFLPEKHHLKLRHLVPLEKPGLPDIKNYYLQILVKDKLIGLAYLQLFTFSAAHLNFDEPGSFQSKIVKTILPRQLNLLICGNLFRINFQGFYFKNEQHNSFIFDAIELFITQNKALKPRGIIVKDCKEVFIENKYTALKYLFFDADVTMEIGRRPNWTSFETYLNDLTKKYFKRAEKIIKAFEGVTKRELDADEILENAITIEKLYWNVVDKQRVRLGTINAAYLYELKLDLKQDFELHALFYNDVMIGFYTFIFYTNEMETHYIGLDYHFNTIHKTYFNILFLSVQKMIERKYDKLELGRTAKEAKANLGAFPKQIFNYVKVKNPVAKIALKYFLKKFNQSENQKNHERLPLK
jgi:hypothetical protein